MEKKKEKTDTGPDQLVGKWVGGYVDWHRK